MLFGTYFKNPEDGKKILTIFHHSELKEYTEVPNLYTPPGGLTIRRIKGLIEECKMEGKDYLITPRASLKLLKRGIY